MATRVLILNRQLAFAVKIKQALEQTGLFDVHPFTKADSAFDFLRDHPQDIALVDFTLPGRSGAKIVQQLRAIQPDLAVVISPHQPPADIESLNLQGMIDAPFSARDIIPVIENALNPGSVQAPPAVPQTRLFPDDATLDQSRMTTGGLEEVPARERFGATQHLGDSADEEVNRSQTRNLGEQPQTDVPSDADEPDRPQTRILSELLQADVSPDQDVTLSEDYPDNSSEDTPGEEEPYRLLGQTRTLSEEELVSPELPSTHLLEEPPEPPSRRVGQTRKFETGEQPAVDAFASRTFDNPPPPPEISSLDQVLKSFGGFEGFETPPVEEEDTPSVPMQDSDAVRQYLATSNPEVGGNFDNVLDAIDPETLELSKRQTDEFQGLVRSLMHNEPHTPLPGRQQQTMDFILTTGMDSVLQEIEKTKTGTGSLVQPDTLPEEKRKPTSFQKITEEEPPMPTLEESGTVSDLLVGISDRGFRNVLSLLRGDEVEESEAAGQAAPTQQDMDEAFRDFFGASRQTPPEMASAAPAYASSDDESEEPPHAFSFDNFPEEPAPDEDATVAGVVLQSTLDESQFPAGFSVDRLIADIEDRLAAHRLNVRPLPSWDMDTTSFRAIIDQAEIREPSFLPEELPPGELVSPDEQATRLSAAIRQGLDTIPVQSDEFDQTRLSEPVPVQSSPESAPEIPLMQDFPPPRANEPAQEEAAVEAAWLEEPAEPLPEMGEMPAFEDLPPQLEFENPPAASEYPAGFGIDHMFDDLLASIETEVEPLPEDEAWGEQESAPEEIRPVSPLDQYITPEERSAAAAALPPSWMEESEEILPGEIPEQSAVEPGWLPDENCWENPEDAAEIESELPPPPDLFQPAHPKIGIWDASPAEVEEAEPEQSPVASIDWGVPENVPAADEVGEAEPEESPVESLDWDLPTSLPVPDAQEVEPERVPISASDWELPESTPVPAEAPVPALTLSPEEAYIAQLALNLTQVSLELSSEGSILTRGSEIVAFAGHLSQMDALELRNVINNDWSVGDEGARLRFISLPSSGKDYMLYSIRTVDDLVLSMIFAGTTPLRVIRQQGLRLVQALESTPVSSVEEALPPAAPSAPVAITPVEPSVTLDDYAYVWLVRNSEQRLSDAVSHAISTGLTTQLKEMSWKIQSLEVDENYVYLLAGVPGDLLPNQVIGDLQRRSAEIASAQDQSLSPQTLWADSYLVLTPGREMSREEIQEFIDFQRMM